MNIEEGKEELNSFFLKAEEDEDPYLVVHFSRIDDRFSITADGMDPFDAVIVIEDLVKMFKIDPIVLSTALREGREN